MDTHFSSSALAFSATPASGSAHGSYSFAGGERAVLELRSGKSSALVWFCFLADFDSGFSRVYGFAVRLAAAVAPSSSRRALRVSMDLSLYPKVQLFPILQNLQGVQVVPAAAAPAVAAAAAKAAAAAAAAGTAPHPFLAIGNPADAPPLLNSGALLLVHPNDITEPPSETAAAAVAAAGTAAKHQAVAVDTHSVERPAKKPKKTSSDTASTAAATAENAAELEGHTDAAKSASAEAPAATATGDVVGQKEKAEKSGNDVPAAATGAAAAPTAPTSGAATKKVDLTLEEELQKERLRKRTAGIVSFKWDTRGERLLLSNARGIWASEAPGALRPLLEQTPVAETPGAAGPAAATSELAGHLNIAAQVLALRNLVMPQPSVAADTPPAASSGSDPTAAAAAVATSEVPIHPSGRLGVVPGAICLLERNSSEAPILDCTYSPCSSYVAFVQGRDIHLLLLKHAAAVADAAASQPSAAAASGGEAAKKSPQKRGTLSTNGSQPAVSSRSRSSSISREGGIRCRLTSSPPDFTSGLAEYVAQEEMSRMEGYWWSPDSRFVAFVEFTEAHVPAVRLQRVLDPPQKPPSQQQEKQQRQQVERHLLQQEADLNALLADDLEGSTTAEDLSEYLQQEHQQEQQDEHEKQEKQVQQQEQQQKKRQLPSPSNGVGGKCTRPFTGAASSSGKSFLVTEEHRFPFSGQQNVKARIGIAQVPSVASLLATADSTAASGSAAAAGADGVLEVPCCTRCRNRCSCSSNTDGSNSSSNNSNSSSGNKWIKLRSWQQLESLKLLSHDEVLLLLQQKQQQKEHQQKQQQKQQQQKQRERQEQKQQQQGKQQKQTGPPPVLLLQLQDRLQQELRICVALPFAVPTAKPTNSSNNNISRNKTSSSSTRSKQQNPEEEKQQQEEELRCVCCYKEKRRSWISLHDDLHQLADSLFCTWATDKYQYNQLYLQHMARPDISFQLLPEGNGLRLCSLLAPPQNYSSFFSAARKAAATAAASGASRPAAADASPTAAADEEADGDEDDFYFFMRVIPQIPEEVQNSNSNGTKASGNNCNKSSLLGRALSPVSSHIICARLSRRVLNDIETNLLAAGAAAADQPNKVVRLNCPYIFLSNPAVSGVHSAVVCEGLPLWLHMHHAIASPRQMWVRFMPNIRELFAADARGECLYNSSLAGKQTEICAADAEGDGNRYTLEAAADYTLEQLQRIPQHIPESVRAGLRKAFFYYADAAGCGQVVFESQHQQTLFAGIFQLLQQPSFFTLQQKQHTLIGAYYSPNPEVHGPPPYRGVVSCYGGPSVQFVTDSWELHIDPRAQALARLGLLVIKADNRGSAGRTTSFEKSIYLLLGHKEAADQAAACLHLCKKGLLKLSSNSSSSGGETEAEGELREGVGIYGVSYGGFLSCMALLLQPHVFSAAVAVAPVTFWEGYSTHYTERYLSQPHLNPAGYSFSSVLPFINARKQLEPGRLLLLHGAADENVLLQHSLVLADALIKHQVGFELICLPSSRHGASSPADAALLRLRLLHFFSLCFLHEGKRHVETKQ